ncbi:type I restriction endonuclease subunit R [Nitratidesulfovibrio sp. D1]|uniref:type I restriction endonuclease subunit R n=1 Tax=Nitratidesulfovibrio sp. D1 TaxID=3440151 RepID=UPI003EBE8A98
MSHHKEIEFENDICNHLAAHGWLYAADDAMRYDRGRALFPEDVVAWTQQTQPNAWDALVKSHGPAARDVLLDRIRKQLDDRGTLDVIRHGVELLGLRQPLAFAQFRPALAMNDELQVRYAANCLRVVRQVRYSTRNENSLDLVLFLNGLPVATVELKTDFTQSVGDAVDQYRFERQPRPKGQGTAEPLLDFPRGALVHFAVSNSLVRMTTRLDGPDTRFLPFDRGNAGAAGNAPNPTGHATAYLWEEVWERESWLEIIGRYIMVLRGPKKQIEKVIFPRYHQLDATRRLVRTVQEEGPGQKYLIQHSAGSGKTNSIAWTAHFLADLHDANQRKMFDSVLVISDRTVLDAQLQEAIFAFERTTGVVATITSDNGSKSGTLATALSGGKKIVVCTIQTFPFALKTVQELAATQGKTFAVIADEAHSSQTGEAASKLKQVLSAEEIRELEDGGEVSNEDILAAQMAARANAKGITYVAFTATPKAKTMELFGRRPDPSRAAGPDNLPAPFHVYSMRQAIEEQFILDVLRNYTPYKLAFRLASNGKEWDEKEVERSEAMKGIMRWVRLHPYNISQKVKLVVEHFRANVAPLLNGQGKAMVVTGSRQEVVRWQLAITKYIREQGYKIGTLVAFSGEVRDDDLGPEGFTEHSKVLNPSLSGRDIREAFGTDAYQILLVANKFQTGFDQPLLCGMYVDKKLAGIQAVQTLSRLNRAHPGKDTTYVLDFANEPAEVLQAFKVYYETAELEDVTDPNLVYDMRATLDGTGYYDGNEVDRVVSAELDPHGTQRELAAAIAPVADRLLKRYKELQRAIKTAQEAHDAPAEKNARDEKNALELFKRNLRTYLRVYSFLSQIFDYGNTDIEKRAIFFRRLLPLLEFGRERDEVDLSGVKLTHHTLRNKGTRNLPLDHGQGDKLRPMGELGTGEVRDKRKARLAEVIAKVNALFEGDLTPDDMLIYVNNVIKGKLLESAVLAEQAASNTKQQFASSPDLSRELLNAIMDALSAHTTMSKQALESEQIRQGLLEILLDHAGLYEELRTKAT